MKGYVADIEAITLGNSYFRKVLYTSKRSQLVVMSLGVGQDIGTETHPDNDQFIRCEQGSGVCVIDGNVYQIESGSAIVIPAGSEHNIINKGNEQMKLYTLYAPAHHKDGTIHETKEEAEMSDEEFDGETSE